MRRWHGRDERRGRERAVRRHRRDGRRGHHGRDAGLAAIFPGKLLKYEYYTISEISVNFIVLTYQYSILIQSDQLVKRLLFISDAKQHVHGKPPV